MTKTRIIAYIVLFAAGIGTGLALGTRARGVSRGAGPSGEAGDVEMGESGPEKAPPPGPPTGSASLATGEPADAAVPISGIPRTLSDAISAIPPLEIETGDGTISGTVKAERGEPLPGVLVRATRALSRENLARLRKREAEPREDRDLPAEVLDLVHRIRLRHATMREAVTDVNGKYVLEGLADVPHTVRAFKQGYDIRPEPGRRRRTARPGGTLDFTASAVLEVPVKVLLPGGSTPRDARIRVSEGPRRSWTESWFPDDPFLRLTPGRYDLRAVAGEDEAFGSKSQAVSLEAEDPLPSLSFQLEQRAGIRVKAVMPLRCGFEYAWLWVLRFTPGNEPDAGRIVRDGRDVRVGFRDGYVHSFRDLEAGTYRVGASLHSSRPAATTTVEVGDSMEEVELALPPPGPREGVVLRVFGPKGDVLGDVEVSSGCSSLDHSSFGGGAWGPRKDGSFFVLHMDRYPSEDEGEESVHYFVRVVSREYGMKTVEYTPEKTAEIRVDFPEPAHLEVTVPGYAGSEFEGDVELTLWSREKKKDRDPFGSFDETEPLGPDGKRSFGPLKPGRYGLALGVKRPYLDDVRSFRLQRRYLDVHEGMNRVSLEIPPLHSLTMIVEPQEQDEQLYLESCGKERGPIHRYEWVWKRKEITFLHLPAGEYLIIRSQGPGAGEMRVTVPAPSAVRFEPMPKNALRVEVKDPGSYLAQAGLRTGDLIVGIDGMEFKNARHIRMVMFGALSRKVVKLAVLRGEDRLEIPVESAKAMTRKGAIGGRFEPTSR